MCGVVFCRATEQLKERASEIGSSKSYTASLDTKAASLASDYSTARAQINTLDMQVKSQTATIETLSNNVKQLE